MKKTRTLKDWLVATRPWSFPASVMPVLILWGYLFYIEHALPRSAGIQVEWLNALLCLPLLVLVHAGGNMVSDYYDHLWGVDGRGEANGVTWISNGLFRPEEIRCYGLSLLSVGGLIGLFLLANSSWQALWMGVVGLLFAFVYPWMKAHSLGDLNILSGFALLPAVGTAFVATGHHRLETLLVILPLGLLTVSILHANNTRDMVHDRQVGLSTLCSSVGLRGAKGIYAFEVLAPYLLTALFVAGEPRLWPLLAVVLTLPLAVRNVRSMTEAGETLPFCGIPTLDKSSALLQTSFGLLFFLGLVLAGVLCL